MYKPLLIKVSVSVIVSGVQPHMTENIRDFVVPTYICGDLPQPCTVRCNRHCPKVLLWIMEEFFYISHDLTEEYHDGRVILGYELMIEAERQYRIK